MNRRSFLSTCLALSVAPAIARAESLMPGRGYKVVASGLHVPQWLNVKDYGAVGDGVTDDSAAFLKAMDDALRLSIAQIIVPAGKTFYAPRLGCSVMEVRLTTDTPSTFPALLHSQ